jgi:hypothetical protein
LTADQAAVTGFPQKLSLAEIELAPDMFRLDLPADVESGLPPRRADPDARSWPEGTVPYDGAWPADRVDVFRWLAHESPASVEAGVHEKAKKEDVR